MCTSLLTESDNQEVHLGGVPVPGRQPATALARDSRPAAALARDSQLWLLAKRDNHVELLVVVLPAAASRLLWEETVATWIANRSAANVNYGIKRARYAFHMLPAKLELKGPAVYTLRYR